MLFKVKILPPTFCSSGLPPKVFVTILFDCDQCLKCYFKLKYCYFFSKLLLNQSEQTDKLTCLQFPDRMCPTTNIYAISLNNDNRPWFPFTIVLDRTSMCSLLGRTSTVLIEVVTFRQNIQFLFGQGKEKLNPGPLDLQSEVYTTTPSLVYIIL